MQKCYQPVPQIKLYLQNTDKVNKYEDLLNWRNQQQAQLVNEYSVYRVE